jgi:CRISPR-associated protein Csd1
MLDIQRPECAYQLGRLFASLERAQEDALPGLNATVKDRYFGAASSTPASVFPRLIRMNQHHIGKLEGGKKVVAEKRIQEIMGRIDAFPSHLGLVDQGLFAIGYYHQRQDFFTKKDKSDE